MKTETCATDDKDIGVSNALLHFSTPRIHLGRNLSDSLSIFLQLLFFWDRRALGFLSEFFQIACDLREIHA
jgi:hypothetical protein